MDRADREAKRIVQGMVDAGIISDYRFGDKTNGPRMDVLVDGRWASVSFPSTNKYADNYLRQNLNRAIRKIRTDVRHLPGGSVPARACAQIPASPAGLHEADAQAQALRVRRDRRA